jgi:hypothetical protein
LFERERLRLRKAVQECVTSIQSMEPAPATIAQAIETKNNNISQIQKLSSSSNGNAQSMSSVLDSPNPNTYNGSTVNPSSRPRGAAFNSNLNNNNDLNPTQDHTLSMKKLYDWENGINAIRNQRNPISIDDNIYLPAEKQGIYMRDVYDGNDNQYGYGGYEAKNGTGTGTTGNSSVVGSTTGTYLGSGPKHQDIIFILTPDEINILASRLQHLKNNDKSNYKSSASAVGVQHSTPYVEPTRITKSLLRPDQKDKWIDKSSIRPNAR